MRWLGDNWHAWRCFRISPVDRASDTRSKIRLALKNTSRFEVRLKHRPRPNGATEEAMKKLWWIAGIAVATAFTVLPHLHKTQPRRNRQPAPSPSQAVLESWNDIGRKLVAIAEDLPEDKYDYKPHPDSRTFVGNLLHVSPPCISSRTLSRAKRPVTAMTPSE